MSFNNGQVYISHMSYADDVVIFGEALLGNIVNMLDVLNMSCNDLGQQINFSKSPLIYNEDMDPQFSTSSLK